jgi:hypothetical protein
MKTTSRNFTAAFAVLLGSWAATATTSIQIQRQASAVVLTWNTQAGARYTIEAAPSPQGPWAAQTNLVAQAGNLSWSIPLAAGQPQQYYRIAENVETAPSQALLAGDAIGQTILDTAGYLSQECASAVFLASQLTGGFQVVANGTLTQNSSGWTYGAAPADRLVVQFTNGTVTAYTVTVMQGDFSNDAGWYLRANHDFRFRVVSGDTIDMAFTTYLNGCTANGTAQGTFKYNGTTYTANVAAGGQYCGSTSSGYTDFTDDHTVTGTVTAAGFNLEVNQRRYYYSISSSRDFASTSQDWINNRLTLGADVYQWSNVQKRRSFSDLNTNNTRPVRYDPSVTPLEWGAEGAVLKNGAPYATYLYSFIPADVYLRFFLVTPAGPIELEKYTRL